MEPNAFVNNKTHLVCYIMYINLSRNIFCFLFPLKVFYSFFYFEKFNGVSNVTETLCISCNTHVMKISS